MSDAQEKLKSLKRQLGACEDTIRIQKTTRKSILRQIAEAREDDPKAFEAIFPDVVAAEARRSKQSEIEVE
jgi:hypothetical protein